MYLYEQKLASLMSKIGKGLVDPVAYDTAWIARVQKLDNPNEPEFPESLQWLRDNQLEDGSWGSKFPVNAHGNTLCTFSALLALKYWNYEEDSERIQRGISALCQLAPLLKQEKYETIGFELLLPTLVEAAQGHQWDLPYEIYKTYEQASKEKKVLLKKFQEKVGFEVPSSWWFSLECQLATNESIYTKANALLAGHSSVAGSPSATAYLLSVSVSVDWELASPASVFELVISQPL